jgi:hypothetical protein
VLHLRSDTFKACTLLAPANLALHWYIRPSNGFYALSEERRDHITGNLTPSLADQPLNVLDRQNLLHRLGRQFEYPVRYSGVVTNGADSGDLRSGKQQHEPLQVASDHQASLTAHTILITAADQCKKTRCMQPQRGRKATGNIRLRFM